MAATLSDLNPLWFVVGLGLVGAFSTAFIWVGKMNSDRESSRGFMEEIRKDLREIRDNVNKIFQRFSSPTTASASPKTLTPLGDTISAALQVSGIVAKLAEDLHSQSVGKSDYEIQIFAQGYIDRWEPESDLEKAIQQCAFDHGLQRMDVMDVFAVELRDALLKKVRQAP